MDYKNMFDRILNLEYESNKKEFKRILKKYFKPSDITIYEDKKNDVWLMHEHRIAYTVKGSDGWAIKTYIDDYDSVRFCKLIAPNAIEIKIKSAVYSKFSAGFRWFWLNPDVNIADKIVKYNDYIKEQQRIASDMEDKRIEYEKDKDAIENAKRFLSRF